MLAGMRSGLRSLSRKILRIEIADRAPALFGLQALVGPIAARRCARMSSMWVPGKASIGMVPSNALDGDAHPHHFVIARQIGPADIEQHQRIGLGDLALQPFALPGENAVGVAALLLDLDLAVAEILVIVPVSGWGSRRIAFMSLSDCRYPAVIRLCRARGRLSKTKRSAAIEQDVQPIRPAKAQVLKPEQERLARAASPASGRGSYPARCAVRSARGSARGTGAARAEAEVAHRGAVGIEASAWSKCRLSRLAELVITSSADPAGIAQPPSSVSQAATRLTIELATSQRTVSSTIKGSSERSASARCRAPAWSAWRKAHWPASGTCFPNRRGAAAAGSRRFPRRTVSRHRLRPGRDR